MGKLKGFLEYRRQPAPRRPVEQRVRDWRELDLPLAPDDLERQAGRCVDCGIPFCHGAGCPLCNSIPDMNELVYRRRWQDACRVLHATNNFPEITGRICPAPCEAACTLSINDEPVTIRQIELQIVERGFERGWIKPLPGPEKTGKSVAVVGSGPAGLAAAQQLARAGHRVVVFEKSERPGGILRYGIPDFKLEKHVIDRRLEQMRAEGVEFQTGVHVGVDVSSEYLRRMFGAVCLATGAGQPRDLDVPGRDSANVLFAMDYLAAQNRLCAGEAVEADRRLSARQRNVVVIGGGDTGSDCVGTARRQGARRIYQLEILPEPPRTRPADTPWPFWPRMMRTSSSHEEGCERLWSVCTKKLVPGADGAVKELHACRVEWVDTPGGWKLKELPGTEFVIETDLVLLALGFKHAVHKGLVENLGLELDEAGNVRVREACTSSPGWFAAGDAVSGASLVVRAIDSGRKAAAAIDRWLRQGS